MTRHVKTQRQAIQSQKNYGLVIQFIIFIAIRVLDMSSSVAVLDQAWEQSGDWAELNMTSPNVTGIAYSESVGKVCEGDMTGKRVSRIVERYKVILGITLLFNIISTAVFLVHFSLWILTLRIFLNEELNYDKETRVTRLTQNSLMSLMTVLIRDVPLSCLNTELLVQRSGSDGLVCIACMLDGRCRITSTVLQSLTVARNLLYFSYITMFINTLWKGISHFYRLTRIQYFNLHFLRAAAAIVFGVLYVSATFTPAMFILMYQYFTIPGYRSLFAYNVANKLVVIGSVVWLLAGSALVCCPLLNAIRLSE